MESRKEIIELPPEKLEGINGGVGNNINSTLAALGSSNSKILCDYLERYPIFYGTDHPLPYWVEPTHKIIRELVAHKKGEMFPRTKRIYKVLKEYGFPKELVLLIESYELNINRIKDSLAKTIYMPIIDRSTIEIKAT